MQPCMPDIYPRNFNLQTPERGAYHHKKPENEISYTPVQADITFIGRYIHLIESIYNFVCRLQMMSRQSNHVSDDG